MHHSKSGLSPKPLRAACCIAMIGLAVLASPATAKKEDCIANSGPARTGILELYTSEGCNSCPPADRWVSALPAKGYTPDRVIPLAFHVDYWDQLGWVDRMAKPQFSERQRMQANRNHARVVYTPQLLLNGVDYRASDAAFSERLGALNSQPAPATLVLRQQPGAARLVIEIDAQRTADSPRDDLQAYVALTENGLDSAIQAGENQGKKLHHDFVVREFIGPIPLDKTGTLHWRGEIAVRAEWKANDLSVAAFLENSRTGEVAQAVSAPACPFR